jgi:hypothetical protein
VWGAHDESACAHSSWSATVGSITKPMADVEYCVDRSGHHDHHHRVSSNGSVQRVRKACGRTIYGKRALTREVARRPHVACHPYSPCCESCWCTSTPAAWSDVAARPPRKRSLMAVAPRERGGGGAAGGCGGPTREIKWRSSTAELSQRSTAMLLLRWQRKWSPCAAVLLSAPCARPAVTMMPSHASSCSHAACVNGMQDLERGA